MVDQAGDRILVHCHGGCDQHEVIQALQARRLWPASSEPLRRRETLSPLDEARREILLEARRQLRRLEPYREAFAESDSIRIGYQVVARARFVATVIGERDDVWDLLALAAQLERWTLAAEAAA